MIYNGKLKRWHPIIYVESPLPGPDSPSKPVRHESTVHHTAGFDKREEAIKEAQDIAARIIQQRLSPGCLLALEEDVLWDGEDIPAEITFFVKTKERNVRRAF